MAKICNKCLTEVIPSTIVIDGKRRNLNNRKFCFTCSPFGSHNTKNFALDGRKIGDRSCIKCFKYIPLKNKNGRRCYSCIQKEREKKIIAKVYGEIVGTSCWLCGYDKGMAGRGVLDFHHMGNKLFGLDLRSMTNLKWDRVFAEMQKCCLLCCRCHREVEYGLVSGKKVIDIFQKKWNTILAQW